MPDGPAYVGPVRLESAAAAFCRHILEDLPEWFGIEEAIEHYCEESERCPAYGITADGAPAGLVTIARRTPDTSEIIIIAVARNHRNKGLGRALVARAGDHARNDGARLLSLKTLGAGHPDPHYAETRAFYEAAGFLAVEEFKDMWGEGRPVLLYAMTL